MSVHSYIAWMAGILVNKTKVNTLAELEGARGSNYSVVVQVN